MALFDQMVDRSPCAGAAVYVDPGVIVGEVAAPEGDERGSGVEQDADPLVVVHRAGKDEAVDGPTAHHVPIGVGLALTPIVGEKMDVHPDIGGALGDLMEECVEKEPVTSGRDAVPDGERAPLGQCAGGAVGAVAEPVCGLTTLSRVSSATRSGALRALETVETDTPVARLTSLMVIRELMVRSGQKTFYRASKTFLHRSARRVNSGEPGDDSF